jgi:hypothetical protein
MHSERQYHACDIPSPTNSTLLTIDKILLHIKILPVTDGFHSLCHTKKDNPPLLQCRLVPPVSALPLYLTYTSLTVLQHSSVTASYQTPRIPNSKHRVHFLLLGSFQMLYSSPATCVTFCSMLFFNTLLSN